MTLCLLTPGWVPPSATAAGEFLEFLEGPGADEFLWLELWVIGDLIR